MAAVTVERVAGSEEELAILSEVVARPADDLPRLVYADWLEERGDPRGAFLRRFVRAAQGGAELPNLAGAPQGWADLTGLTWTHHIVESGLMNRRADLLALARPALRLVVEPANFDDPPPTPTPLGTTRLGGDPDLPAGAVYPTAADGVPLHFLGQFDLSDFLGTIGGQAFPPGGLLSVFRPQAEGKNCYPTPEDCPRLVRWSPAGNPLGRVARPVVVSVDEYGPERHAPFRPGLRIIETLCLPGDNWLDPPLSPADDDKWLDRMLSTGAEKATYLLLGHVSHGNTGEEPLKGRPGMVQLILVPYYEGPDYGVSDMSLSYHLPAADLKAGRFDRLEATFG